MKINLEIDDELIADYLGGFDEAFEMIEANIAELNNSGDSQEIYNEMLRHMHSIKGNARMCELVIPERLAHVIESVVVAFKEGEVDYFTELGGAIHETLERVKESSQKIFNHEDVDEDYYLYLVKILSTIPDALNESEALVNKFLHITTHIPLKSPKPKVPTRTEQDLKMLKMISDRCQPAQQLYQGRSARLMALFNDMDLADDSGINSVQMQAAILSDEIDASCDGFNAISKKYDLQGSKQTASDMLAAMQGWDEAIQILSAQPQQPGRQIINMLHHYDNAVWPASDDDRLQVIMNTLKELATDDSLGFEKNWVILLTRAVQKQSRA